MPRSLIAVFVLVLLASLARADDALRLVPSADGSELIDTSAKLAWSRCVEGMRWDGKHCVGEARLATHAEALGFARARSSAEGRLWRVPRVTELKRLFEHLAHGGDATTLAPAAPGGLYWSSTARIESEAVNTYNYRAVERGATERRVDRLAVQQGWAVEQPGGAPRDVAKREKLPVRLVRAIDS